MLPKTNRISRKQWDPLFKSSKKIGFSWGLVRVSEQVAALSKDEVVGEHLSNRSTATQKTSLLKVSIVVSKKVAKLSVDRHIIKRFLYSLFDTKRETPQTFMIHVSNWKFGDADFLKQVAADIATLF